MSDVQRDRDMTSEQIDEAFEEGEKVEVEVRLRRRTVAPDYLIVAREASANSTRLFMDGVHQPAGTSYGPPDRHSVLVGN